MSLLLAGLSYGVLLLPVPGLPAAFDYLFIVLLYINLAWTLFNLIPLHPLDGSKLLSIPLEGLFGLRGMQLALSIGLLIGGLITYLCFSSGWYLTALILLLLMLEHVSCLSKSSLLSDEDFDPARSESYRQFREAIQTGNKEKALLEARQLYGATHRGEIHRTAACYLAHEAALQANMARCYQLLAPQKKSLDQDLLELFVHSCYSTHHWDEACQMGTELYKQRPSAELASLNSRCHAQLGQVEETIGWLTAARHQRVKALAELLEESDFDPVREDPLFRSWVEVATKGQQ